MDLTYTVPPTAGGVESSWWPLLTDVSNSLGRHLTVSVRPGTPCALLR
ncbi:MAG: hypothetical protein WDN01_07030 [Rhizomicrobium sp.]